LSLSDGDVLFRLAPPAGAFGSGGHYFLPVSFLPRPASPGSLRVRAFVFVSDREREATAVAQPRVVRSPGGFDVLRALAPQVSLDVRFSRSASRSLPTSSSVEVAHCTYRTHAKVAEDLVRGQRPIP